MDIFITNLNQQIPNKPKQQSLGTNIINKEQSLFGNTGRLQPIKLLQNNNRNQQQDHSFLESSSRNILSQTFGQRKATQSPTNNKRLNPKEYFKKYIREENKKYIQKQRQMTIESKSYIEYDRRHKNNFKQKVAQYIEQMDKEEKEVEFAKLSTNQEKINADISRLHVKPQMITIEQLEVSRQDISETFPPLINQRNNAIFMIQQKLSQTIGELNPTEQKQLASLSKKKELPRYMQPNQAWLTKDKTIPQNPELYKDASTNNQKSKGSSLFPTINKMLKKKKDVLNGEEQLGDEQQLTAKQVRQQNKYFVINREDPLIVDLFKKICQEKRESNIIRARLTKGKLKAHLSRKYKGRVAEKILQYLDFSIPLDYNGYIDLLEKLLNFGQDKLKRIAFTVFDFNDDRSICQLDLYSIMKMYESDDQVFVNAYSYDICKLIAFLDQKKIQKGNQNYELNQKLRNIQKKVEQAMKQYQAQKQPNNKSGNNKNSVQRTEQESKLGSIGNVSLQSSIQNNTTDNEDEELEEDDDDEYEESSFEEEVKTTTNKTLAPNKSQAGGFISRRNSMQSRKGGKGAASTDLRKDFKRMNTNMSRMSKVSRGSGRSVVSARSRASSRRYQGGFFSHYTEQNEEEEKENPFDAIFGKDIYKRMKGNKDYNEKMIFNEFKQQIQWGENLFPQFIIDLIHYISSFLIEDYIKQKQAQEKDELEQKQLHDMIDQRRLAGEQFDENFLIEQFKRQRMNDMDAELLITKNKIGESRYRKLLRFFKNVCKNPVESKDSGLFMTQESLTKKLKNHFGHKCDFISQRLYYNLSNNVNLKRIYFREFIEKIMILWEGSQRDLFRFAFQMADIDHDGLLNGPDLLTVQDSVDLNSEYGQEILVLVDHYVNTHLMTKSRVNPKHFLHLDNFIMLLGGSNAKIILIEELKLKILCKAGKYAQKSVFFKENSNGDQQTTTDGLRNRRLNKYGMTNNNVQQQQQTKRAILMWSGGNLLKEKKRVTFSYIPAHKDEDDENYQQRRPSKKRLLKDLPTSVADLKNGIDEGNNNNDS